MIKYLRKLTFLSSLILLWCNVGIADSISEFEMAGAKLKIGILEVMTIEQIEENLEGTDSYDEKYFRVKYIPDPTKFKNLNFEEYYLTIDSSNEIYPIVAISAIKWFDTDFDKCVEQQNMYADKLEKIFGIKKEILPIQDFSHKYGTGSKWRPIIYEHPNFKKIKSDTASVLCYHYGTSPENDLYGKDNLKINLLTREYADVITVKRN
tara:strand:+ start:68 stop:691 length:624 start_codon:yes stop_codon:yes gene_type:complete